MMLGSVECEGIPYGNPDDAYWTSEPTTAAELRTRVKQIVPVDDAEADRLIALYKSHRPNDSFGDLAAVMSGDNSALRTSAYAIAERKAALAKAPVYKYYFQWYSPVREGKLRSYHTLDIPFVFQNVDIAQSMVGTGADRQPLADKMSAAWAAFAKSGNPNTKVYPNGSRSPNAAAPP